jgi:hypothetical protein
MPKPKEKNEKLKKAYYSFEEAMRLLDVSRDTLVSWGLPFRRHPKSRKMVISEDAIKEAYESWPLVGGDFDPSEV